jgi:hypothetical protein
MHIIILWFINFIQIVLIGYQTKNVINNKYYAAIISQFVISVIQVIFVLFVVKMSIIPACLVMGTSGGLGIITGMWIYKKIA